MRDFDFTITPSEGEEGFLYFGRPLLEIEITGTIKEEEIFEWWNHHGEPIAVRGDEVKLTFTAEAHREGFGFSNFWISNLSNEELYGSLDLSSRAPSEIRALDNLYICENVFEALEMTLSSLSFIFEISEEAEEAWWNFIGEEEALLYEELEAEEAERLGLSEDDFLTDEEALALQANEERARERNRKLLSDEL